VRPPPPPCRRRPQTTDTRSESTPPGRSVLHHGMPAAAHQRLTPVSMPAYSSPLMPYLLMDEDDVVVLPRRRTLARLSDELDDDPVLKWYEDRIHHAQVEASAIAQSHLNDICTPKPRHISVTPMYTPKAYPEPVAPRLNKYSKYRSTVVADAMKPVRRNIELRSRFSGAHDAAQNTYKRMGDSADPEHKAAGEPKPAESAPPGDRTNGEENQEGQD